MKVTRYNRGYAVSVSEHEMAWMRAALKHVDWEAFRADLSSPQHRSLSRRLSGGYPLRTDHDRRTGPFRSMPYEGPHNDQ